MGLLLGKVRKELIDLDSWLKTTPRKPLVIRGARQVGKSSLVQFFAAQRNLALHEINLEKHKQLQTIIKTNDATLILQEIQLICKKGDVSAGRSLLFIDEVQAIPETLEALRYLQEEYPALPIIAAGSLLEFTLSEHEYSMPVGRIEYLFMGPLRFEEFLLACGEQTLVTYLRSWIPNTFFSETAHQQLLQWQRIYLMIGGMPEAVQRYVDTKDFSLVRKVQASIISTYSDDFSKYGKRAQLIRLQQVLDHIPSSIGEKIKYVNIDREAKSMELKNALLLLAKAQVIHLAYATAANGVPLASEIDYETFKPYLLDCGLLQYMLNAGSLVAPTTIDDAFINEGKLAEPFVAQELCVLNASYTKPQLLYWLREAKQSNAEVDFVAQLGASIVPIEVKAGKSGKLKSLHRFILEKRVKTAVRFDSNLPSVQKVDVTPTESKEEVSFVLHSLPLYMVGQMIRAISMGN